MRGRAGGQMEALARVAYFSAVMCLSAAATGFFFLGILGSATSVSAAWPPLVFRVLRVTVFSFLCAFTSRAAVRSFRDMAVLVRSEDGRDGPSQKLFPLSFGFLAGIGVGVLFCFLIVSAFRDLVSGFLILEERRLFWGAMTTALLALGLTSIAKATMRGLEFLGHVRRAPVNEDLGHLKPGFLLARLQRKIGAAALQYEEVDLLAGPRRRVLEVFLHIAHWCRLAGFCAAGALIVLWVALLAS